MKSHVTLATSGCPICHRDTETGDILLDTRLRQRFEHRTRVGLRVCDGCRREGFYAVVEARPHGEGAFETTGQVAFVKHDAWSYLFNLEPPVERGFVWCEPAAFDLLRRRAGGLEEEKP